MRNAGEYDTICGVGDITPNKTKERQMEMPEDKKNRHGKHHPDKVQFGGMVTPEFKAIAQLTANKLQCSLMELMQRGVDNLATGAGILKDGHVTPQYHEAVAAMAEIIRTSLASKRRS